jgi:uncharacterized membrane protein YqjE
LGGRFHLRRTRVAAGVGGDRFSAIIVGFQSTKVDLAVRAFQQKKVVLTEFASQVVGLLVMLVVGYLTRSIWSLVVAGLVQSLVNTLLGHIWFEGPSNRLRWERAALDELVGFGRWICCHRRWACWPCTATVSGSVAA